MWARCSNVLLSADTAGESAIPVEVGTDGALTVGADQVVVCTFTNTRLSRSIEPLNDFSGAVGAVTLNIGTSSGGGEVDSVALTGDGTTGPNTVDTGTYYVSESLTTPANYTTGLVCADTAGESAIPVEMGREHV